MTAQELQEAVDAMRGEGWSSTPREMSEALLMLAAERDALAAEVTRLKARLGVFDIPDDHEMCIVCVGSGPKGTDVHRDGCPYKLKVPA